MTATLELVCQKLVDELRGMPGLTHAHGTPPEQINEWPALVVYPGNGYWRQSTHSDGNRPTVMGAHSIFIEVHVPDKAESGDYTRLQPFADEVPRRLFAAFLSDRFDDAITTLGDYRQGGANAAIRYEMAPGNWGGVETRMYRFTFEVSVEGGIYT